MENIKYVGMDIHKTITVIAVLNVRGQMESHSKVKTKAENLCDFFVAKSRPSLKKVRNRPGSTNCSNRWYRRDGLQSASQQTDQRREKIQ